MYIYNEANSSENIPVVVTGARANHRVERRVQSRSDSVRRLFDSGTYRAVPITGAPGRYESGPSVRFDEKFVRFTHEYSSSSPRTVAGLLSLYEQ